MEIMIKLLKEFFKRVIVIAIIILALSFILGLIFTGLSIHKTIRNLDIYTLMTSLLAIVGKVLGALTPTTRLATTSIVAPSTAKYAHEAARQIAEDSLASWIALLLAVVLAYCVALALKNILLS